jgi:hypothetical protein
MSLRLGVRLLPLAARSNAVLSSSRISSSSHILSMGTPALASSLLSAPQRPLSLTTPSANASSSSSSSAGRLMDVGFAWVFVRLPLWCAYIILLLLFFVSLDPTTFSSTLLSSPLVSRAFDSSSCSPLVAIFL